MVDVEFIDDLFPHQEEGVRKISDWEENPLHNIVGGILSFDMGLGKTRTILELINRKKTSGNPTLVVCPLSALSVWARDIKKFYPNELTYLVLHSSSLDSDLVKTIMQSKLEEYDVIITTYDVVRKQFLAADTRCYIVRRTAFSEIESRLYKKSEIDKEAETTGVRYKIVSTKKTNEPDPSHYTPIYTRYSWRRIVADESTYFCGPNTMIGNAMIALNADSYICMTGTPIMNYSSDLYNMFRFMGLTWFKKDWNSQNFHNKGLSSRVLAKKYADTKIVLPKAEYVTIEITLSEFEKKIYNIVVDKLKGVYSLYKKGDLSFAAPLEMFLRLRQICACAGVLNVEPIKKIRQRKDLEAIKLLLETNEENTSDFQDLITEAEADLKEDTIDRLFEDPSIKQYLRDKSNNPNYSKINRIIELALPILEGGHKILIFSCFVQVLNILNEAFKNLDVKVLQLDGSVASKKRGDMQKVFNEGEEYRVFLSSFKAGGMAIELTAADTVVLCEPYWNVPVEDQAIARSHRTGQKRNVTVYSLIAIPSFETYLLKVQNRKYLMTKDFFQDHEEKYKKYKSGSSVAKQIIENIIYEHI